MRLQTTLRVLILDEQNYSPVKKCEKQTYKLYLSKKIFKEMTG